MASTTAHVMSAGASPPPPRKMPQLKYRNAAPTEASDVPIFRVSTVPSPFSNTSVTTSSPSFPMLKSNAGSATIARGSRGSAGAAQHSPTLPTKKKSAFLSFFGTKEPSTQAFLDYQAEIRKKQHASRHGSIKPTGMPMVSSAKLPENVPRVNSRWDGVPDAMAKKEKEKKFRPQSGFMSRRSNPSKSNTEMSRRSSLTGSLPSSRDTHRHPSSLRSFGSASNLAAPTSHIRYPAVPRPPSSPDSFHFNSTWSTSMRSSPSTPLSDVSSFLPKPVRDPSTLSEESGLRECTSHLSKDIAVPGVGASRTSTPHDCLPQTPQAFEPLDPGKVPEDHSLGSENGGPLPGIQTTILSIPSHYDRTTDPSPNIHAAPATIRRRPIPKDESNQCVHPMPGSVVKRETVSGAASPGKPRSPRLTGSPSLDKQSRLGSGLGHDQGGGFVLWEGAEETGSDEAYVQKTEMPMTLEKGKGSGTKRKSKLSIFRS